MHAGQIVLAPVVSEKSYASIADGRYSFKVHPDAHKTQIKQAVEELFEVKVRWVNIVKVQAKPKRRGAIKERATAGRRQSCSSIRVTRSSSTRERRFKWLPRRHPAAPGVRSRCAMLRPRSAR